MVRYGIMKRVTKLLASALFIVTILTVYLTFDFAISNALSNKGSSNKHEHLHHDVRHKRTSPSQIINNKIANPPVKTEHINNVNHIVNQDRNVRSLQSKNKVIKHAPFHKSKTGIKINQIKKPIKQQQHQQQQQRNKNALTTKLAEHKPAKLQHNLRV